MIKSLYPIFQHWSEKGSVYIISDTHFDDIDREYMGYNITEKEQISILKQFCHKNDTLIHLGDVGNPEWLNELKCYKVLIMGNHDQSVEKFKTYFNEIYSGPLMVAEKLLLSHEPICLESSMIRKAIAFNVHGHDHSGEYYDDYHLNLVPNVFGYFPLNLKQIIDEGLLKNILSIHRQIIDEARKKKEYDLFNK